MTTIKKRGSKSITTDIEDKFGLMLDELSKLEPNPKPIKKSATSLIIKHRIEIKALLDRGFSAEQIVNQLAKINLDLSPETIRIIIRNTDDEGNRIMKNIKPRSKSRKTSIKAFNNTPTNTTGTTIEDETKRTLESRLEDAQYLEEHPKITRGPITIDDDL